MLFGKYGPVLASVEMSPVLFSWNLGTVYFPKHLGYMAVLRIIWTYKRILLAAALTARRSCRAGVAGSVTLPTPQLSPKTEVRKAQDNPQQ